MIVIYCPAGEGAGRKFRVSLSHQFAWIFLAVLINEDLTTGPGVVGEFATALAGFLWHDGGRALPAVGKELIPRILEL